MTGSGHPADGQVLRQAPRHPGRRDNLLAAAVQLYYHAPVVETSCCHPGGIHITLKDGPMIISRRSATSERPRWARKLGGW